MVLTFNDGVGPIVVVVGHIVRGERCHHHQ